MRGREIQCSRLSTLIAERMGLHFPPDRWDDLERGFAAAAREFGFDDAQSCADWLFSAPATRDQIQVLANHLTVGETYFFRDQATLQALSNHVLPDLIRSRRGKTQRLRFWSAACCSGEEPYSLAILLHQLLPDLADWHVTITATDVNPRFLHKAAEGVYSEWSFRNAPPGLNRRYFTRTAGGRWSLIPEIRRMVSFSHLNLVEDVYPSLETNTNAMDVILCRNVLMYFAPTQMKRVIDSLGGCLIEGGWIIVSPSEASSALFSRFETVNLPDAIFFRKPGRRVVGDWQVAEAPTLRSAAESFRHEPAAVEEPDTLATLQETVESVAPLAAAEALYRDGRYDECASFLIAAEVQTSGPSSFSLLARALANQGRLDEALQWCERWIATDKMNPAGHYLRAVVLIEQGTEEEARASLQRAIYLDPDFVLAHFTLGSLAKSAGRLEQAEKHFANALMLLRRFDPGALLPESEGLTVGRLTETIGSIPSSGGSN